MCGLVVTINVALSPGHLDRLQHRGPDGAGLEHLYVGGHDVTLGHRRLAIIDLSEAGYQPMTLPGTRGTIAYNGEVYNHEELRARLAGHTFRGHSDSESVLHWLDENGIDGCVDFNGIFAFAYVDRAAHALYLVRDPFGVKPLYYARRANGLVACSELAPLLSLLNAEIDPESIALLLRMRYLPSPYTLYKDVWKVRPGHYVRVDLSSPDLAIYDKAYAVPSWEGISPMPFDQATEQYAALVEQAVNRQLMSDVEVGVLLSGGVDSALIAHHMARRAGARVKAFSVGFDDSYPENELAEARATAEFVGLEFHERRLNQTDFIGALQRIARVVEEPLATTSIIPMHFLSELAASQVKVVLSGQGADEASGGYRRYRGYALASRVPSSLTSVANWAARRLTQNESVFTRGLLTLGAADELDRLLHAYQVFSTEEILRLTGLAETRSRDLLAYAHRTWRCEELPSPAARMMRLDLRMGLSDDLLLYTDRVTMRHSLECRVPFLDLDVVRFMESLPQSYKICGLNTKRLHKAAAQMVLPRSIIRRKKRGFLSPSKEWFRDSGQLRRILSDHGERLGHFLDMDAINRVVDKHAAGIDQERQLFLVLTLAIALE